MVRFSGNLFSSKYSVTIPYSFVGNQNLTPGKAFAIWAREWCREPVFGYKIVHPTCAAVVHDVVLERGGGLKAATLHDDG